MPWTLLTSIFVHGGFTHLLFNMITLYFFGNYLNLLLGRSRFLLVYFVGGIIGSVFYILLALLLGSPYTSVVGASGAIFALGGTLTMLRPKLRVLVFPIPAPIPIWAAIIGGFLIMSFLPNVAWEAHLGGLLAGLALGYLFRKRIQTYYYY
jgi:membrane associated rhomboid family serine protease